MCSCTAATAASPWSHGTCAAHGCSGHCSVRALCYYPCRSFLETAACPLPNLLLGLNHSPPPHGPPFSFCYWLWPAVSCHTQHCVLILTAAPAGRGNILLQTATLQGHGKCQVLRCFVSITEVCFFQDTCFYAATRGNHMWLAVPGKLSCFNL